MNVSCNTSSDSACDNPSARPYRIKRAEVTSYSARHQCVPGSSTLLFPQDTSPRRFRISAWRNLPIQRPLPAAPLPIPSQALAGPHTRSPRSLSTARTRSRSGGANLANGSAIRSSQIPSSDNAHFTPLMTAEA
jgi:hypothetical protein